MRGKALVHCGLVLLSLWLCIQSVPIGVDQNQEKPPEEQLESPQSAVSQADAADMRYVGCDISVRVWVTTLNAYISVSDLQHAVFHTGLLHIESLSHVLWFMLQDTGLHYDRYLREVIEYLEKDPHFKEKLKNADMDEIKVSFYV